MGLGRKLFNAQLGAGLSQGATQGANQYLDLLKTQLAQRLASQEAEKQRAFSAEQGALDREHSAGLVETQLEASAAAQREAIQAELRAQVLNQTHERNMMYDRYGLEEGFRLRLAEDAHIKAQEILDKQLSGQLTALEAQHELGLITDSHRAKLEEGLTAKRASYEMLFQHGDVADMGRFVEMTTGVPFTGSYTQQMRDLGITRGLSEINHIEAQTRNTHAGTEAIFVQTRQSEELHPFAVRAAELSNKFQEYQNRNAEVDARVQEAYGPRMAELQMRYQELQNQALQGEIDGQELQTLALEMSLLDRAFDYESASEFVAKQGVVSGYTESRVASFLKNEGENLQTYIAELDTLLANGAGKEELERLGLNAWDVRELVRRDFGVGSGAFQQAGSWARWARSLMGFGPQQITGNQIDDFANDPTVRDIMSRYLHARGMNRQKIKLMWDSLNTYQMREGVR